jgi:HK97 family phage portal protein
MWLTSALRGACGTKAGVSVTPDTALNSSTVYACTRILAETIASLPLVIYRRTSDGGKEPYPGHPLYDILHSLPNDLQTSFELREMLMGHLALRGNSYALKQIDGGGNLISITPLSAARMTPRKDFQTGRIVYDYITEDGQMLRYPMDSIWHIRGLSSDGMIGLSPVSLARETIGLAIGAEQYGAQFFGQAAVPGGIVEHPGVLKQAARENLKASLQEFAANKRHQTMILEEGLQWKQVGMSNIDSQFLETRVFETKEIARWFNVPLVMLGEADKSATFASAEQFFLSFATHTIRPWCVRWEQSINRCLFTPKERKKYFAEFKIDALLRGDLQTRYKAYAQARQWGWLCVNDVRSLENLNPVPNGDIFLQPMNMVEAGTPPPEVNDGKEKEEGPGAGKEDKKEVEE